MADCKKGIIRDLFYSVDNEHLDLARVLAFLSWCGVIALAVYRVTKGQEVELTDLSQSLLEVLIGTGIVVGGKDIARSLSIKKGGREPVDPFGYGEPAESDGIDVEVRR